MARMVGSPPDFPLEVDGIKGLCPAGETWANQDMAERKISVFSCEGPCVRGEIARLAANMVAEEAALRPCVPCGSILRSLFFHDALDEGG